MSDCIVWTGPKAGKGYGVKMHNGKLQYVHRLAAAEAYGEIPKGMVVAHTCDNPPCYNPEHLRVCTQRENLADMRQKNRQSSGDKHGSKTMPHRTAKGERVANSKLTAEQVLQIRAMYVKSQVGKASNTSLSAIAKQFGINFQTVHKIITRKTWKHL